MSACTLKTDRAVYQSQKHLRHWRGVRASTTPFLWDRAPLPVTWCKPRGEMENERPQLAPCLSPEKGLARAHLCLGVHVRLQEERGGIYTQKLLLCKSYTRFHKTVQVDLPKAPACDQDCLERTVFGVLGVGSVATAGMMQELERGF